MSNAVPNNPQNPPSDGVAGEELLQFIERAERLHEEKKGIEGDLKELFAEARGRGFDVKIIKLLMKERGTDHSELQERETILELYRSAVEAAERANRVTVEVRRAA